MPSQSAIEDLFTAADLPKANDNAVVHLSGAETIAGVKTLSDKLNANGSVKLGTSSTTGYVWTATDNAGNGSWQAATGGGGTGGSLNYYQPVTVDEFTYSTNATFTTSAVVAAVLVVTLNGVTLDAAEVTSTSSSVTIAPLNHALVAGDKIRVLYANNNSYAGTTANDVEITDPNKGFILRSPNGTRWRVTVNNTGNLITTSL